MARYNYSMKTEKDKSANAVGRNLPISTKKSIEVCNFIRNMNVKKAKTALNDVISMKKPVAFKRFKGGLGHKKGKGIGAGRYPIKTCTEILTIVESAEANARFKGLDAENMILKHVAAQKAGQQWHYGRQRRRKMKRSHIEIILTEGKKKKTEKKDVQKDKATEAKKPTEEKVSEKEKAKGVAEKIAKTEKKEVKEAKE